MTVSGRRGDIMAAGDQAVTSHTTPVRTSF
jgi:hypothetical protein